MSLNKVQEQYARKQVKDGEEEGDRLKKMAGLMVLSNQPEDQMDKETKELIQELSES